GGWRTAGNGGANYTVSFATVSTGTITVRPITVTAATDSKGYDGTTSSVGVPAITSGNIASGDVANFTQTFNSKNVGTGKSLTPTGLVNDGNGGANYSVTLNSIATGVITARSLSVAAVTDTKPYDATTASAGVPVITTGTLAAGDTANFSQTFDNKNVGTGKVLNPAGSATDGNGGANYLVSFSSVNTGVITGRTITVTAVTDTKTYDGT